MAVAGVYIAFIQVFVAQGFGTALIQRRELESEHLESALWIALATAALFCFLSLLLGGVIAHFFDEARVTPIIGWLSFSFLFYALSSVPMAILTRELDFRSLAIRSLLATAAGGAVGLTMAFTGWGAWSLVGQQLTNAVVGCVCLWLAVPWRPHFRVSGRHLRDLYGFALSITGNDILWFFSQKSDQTLVGYGFGALALGPYALASRVNQLMIESISGPFQSVALPTLSKLQDDPSRLERAFHKFTEICSVISFPMFAGIIVVAPDFVPWLFGPKWTSAIPILQILAAYGVLRVGLAFMHPLMLAKGRPGLYLLLFVLHAGLTLIGCLVAVRWSPELIAFSLIASMFFFTIVFLFVAKSALELRIRSLLRTFVFPGGASLLMLVVVAVLRTFVRNSLGQLGTLALCVAVGVLVYVLSAVFLRPDLVRAIREVVGNILSRPMPIEEAETPLSSQI